MIHAVVRLWMYRGMIHAGREVIPVRSEPVPEAGGQRPPSANAGCAVPYAPHHLRLPEVGLRIILFVPQSSVFRAMCDYVYGT